MDGVAQLPASERAVLFVETAARMAGVTSPVIPEKDFWVCFVLRRLFMLDFRPALLFKGGTSLSKAFQLIERFSDDIDLTLNRGDLGFGGENDPAVIEGRKAQKRQIEALASACSAAVRERLLPALRASIAEVLGDGGWNLEAHDKGDGQVDLHFEYPRGLPSGDYGGLSYVPSFVRMEIGARSDQEPAREAPIRSYAAEHVPDYFKQPETRVLALAPERTFWEKVTIFHAEYSRPVRENAHPAAWNQLSRHAYDIAMMVRRGVADRALERLDLLEQVARHKDAFFYSAWAQYKDAAPGSLHVAPGDALADALRRDYDAMRPMLFREVPTFDEILGHLAALEARINSSRQEETA